MAKFLDGSNVQSSFIDLIKNTEKELFIVSPYLKISTQTKNYLTSIDKQKIPITIVYRPPALKNVNSEDLVFFNGLENLKLYECENMHSKCYINEKDGIITSMNLHEHSQTHNWEMGIKFSQLADPEIYNEVSKELKHMGSHMKLVTPIKKIAEPQKSYRAEPSQKPAQKPPQKAAYKPTEAPNKGLFTKILDTVTGESAYCIRCGEGLPKFDLQKPYCDKHFASWARFRNIKYPEKYCHGCGSDSTKSEITFEKPTCKSCFREYYK